MKLLLLVLTTLSLVSCQVASINVAPVVEPGTGQTVVITSRGGTPLDRPSQFLAAQENFLAELNSSKEDEEVVRNELGPDDPKKGIGYATLIAMPKGQFEKTNGQLFLGALPLVSIRSVGIPKEKLDQAMPKFQKWCYHRLKKHFEVIPVTKLRQGPQSPPPAKP